jgi:hypothetical protein
MQWLGLSAVMLPLFLLAGCTPEDEAYCRSYGVEDTPEYSKCMNYYHAQQAAFEADRAVCDTKADLTYPQSLYDHGHLEPVMGGAFIAGHYTPMTQYVSVGPDFQKNAQLDDLRMRIIAPCMAAYGWNSPETWQAGKHKVVGQRHAYWWGKTTTAMNGIPFFN